MNNKDFDQGFVDRCIDLGLGLPDIEELMRKRACTDMFENEGFRAGFADVVGEARLSNMTNFEKVACVEQLLSDVADEIKVLQQQ